MATATVINTDNDQSLPQILVSGACEPGVNDLYVVAGVSGGKPYWLGNGYYIYYDNTNGYWVIHSTLGTTQANGTYVVLSDDPWPALDGWIARDGCTPGFPALKLVWAQPPVPSTCANDYPEVVLTVTGTTGTITWCGETWVLPGDSGVQKTVCPTTFWKQQEYQIDKDVRVQHIWKKAGQLSMSRQYNLSYSSGSGWWASKDTCFNKVKFKGSVTDSVLWSWYSSNFPLVGGPLTEYQYIYLSLISNEATVTYNNYLITNAFFGSYVDGTTTYTWERGNGWPGPATA